MKHYRILSLFIILTITIHLSAQDYNINIKHFTTGDGLANLDTRVVHKSKDGFIWVSTKYGLNRYDGYQFQLYTKENSGLYQNNQITHIIDGEEQTLLIFYYKENTQQQQIYAADIFDTKTRKATPFQSYFKQKLPFDITDIQTVKVNDPKKRPFMVTKNGALFLLKNRQFVKIFEAKDKTISVVTIDEQDNIHIGLDNEIWTCNFNGNIIKRQTCAGKVNRIWIDETNQIWIESYQPNFNKDNVDIITLSTILKNEHQIYHQFERDAVIYPTEFINGFYYIGNNNWLISEPEKVYLKNFKTRFTYDLSTKLLSGKFLIKSSIDKGETSVWVAQPNGLYQIIYKANFFKYIYTSDKPLDSRGITEGENGNIYFVCRNAFQFSPKQNQLRIISDTIYAYGIQYHDNTLFLSNYDNTQLGTTFHLNTKEVTVFQNKLSNQSYAFCFLKTNRANEYLVGTEKGLVYINFKTGVVRDFDRYNDFNILQKSIVNAIQKRGDKIWIATENGIFLMTEKDGVLQHFSTETDDLPFNHINHFYIDGKTFWLASRGFGLIEWQPFSDTKNKKSTYQTYTINDGLSHNYLYAVYQDDFNRLWITSDKGLMMFDKKNKQVRTFTTADGLIHNEFNFTSHYKAADGTLYFGGLGGVFSVHPKDFITQNQNYTNLKLTAIAVLEDGKAQTTNKLSDYYHRKKIELRPKDKFIELSFALLDFANKDNHLYAYRIKGYQDEWIYTKNNFIRFNTLPYGNHQLEIKGKSGSKDWSKQQLLVNIHVLRPFYLQWWFIVLIVILGAAMVYLFLQNRTKQLEKDKQILQEKVQKRTLRIEADRKKIAAQAEKLAELDELKNRFFTNITHEFRTPLTLIIGPVEQILKQVPPPNVLKRRMKGILKNARLMLNNTNQLLELTKIEAGKIKVTASYGDIVEHTREMTESFEPLATKKSQRLIFQSIPTQWETNFDTDKWNKIVYNLLLNAVKFTPEYGTIKLNITKHQQAANTFIKLAVKDTGVGIPKEELDNIFGHFYQVEKNTFQREIGSGIGLALVKELVELQNGQISVTSEIGKGTSFFVDLPVLDVPKSEVATIKPSFNYNPIINDLETETIATTNAKNKQTENNLEILIVEDNEEIREYLRYCLEEKSYIIHEAKNGQEGIEKAIMIIPDLIISDVMMPQKDGFELTKTIRSTVSTSHIPIILLTAKTALKSRLTGLSRGADVYLTKPFSPDELTIQVQKLITIRQLLQQRYGKGEVIATKNSYPQEDEFIKKLNAYISKNLDNTALNGDEIAKHLFISRVHLHRKLKALTNQSISEYVRTLRLNKALELLKENQSTISEIAYQTGFGSISYFSRSFKKQFGKNPSEMRG